ncbi:DHA2 family efflux MFS transporter permease subunit [Stakelama saccharophila]|uniref:DHA2 family efflux MFS transporter permease subunit n=1 Tax=Stakelama saccharophila TaxID=3075605 RepID=A0ABZ0BB33_9SPHN|nr:DHA2 family efflux MFS transporter permease subunit [Stakelama sp. W311]WNO54499.1 DHA2 family efflux MFS transporter permease subunit [Stakelama sp. W311]
MTDNYPSTGLRRLITGSVMAAALMNSLDMTIANVALPHMQGSVSASTDQITWVLTSYIVAAAIMTPLTGWLAGQFGRKRLMLISIIGFTIASGLCGIATSLGELVGFRLMQGIFGAALIPMSQAILLDINPPENHGPAMSVWGMGVILGPIIGPALGGYLTENLSWRWVFYINLPVGILAWAGLFLFLNESRDEQRSRFDFFGFGMLALGIGCLQIMLDRGQQLDWFSSREIMIEAAASVLFFYLFVVHTITAERPFINPALFKDRNFVAGSVLGFFIGVMIFSVLALLPPLLEGLMGYPVVLTGLVTAPRGIGTMVAMVLVGKLITRFDTRLLILTGLGLVAFSTYAMSGFSLQMDEWPVIWTGFIQGLGTGLVFVPLSAISFTTLDPKLRNEGTAMFTLIRNVGSAIGISTLQAMTIRNGAVVHSRLVEDVRPDNPLVRQYMPSLDFSSLESLTRANEQITGQAMMVAYIDAFYALFIIILLVAPLLLLMRPPRKDAGGPSEPVHMD